MPDEAATPQSGANAKPVQPYDVAPVPVQAPPVRHATATPSDAGKPKLDTVKLLDEFDDDEDLTRDPEVERASTPHVKAEAPVDAAALATFVKLGLGDARIIAAVGGGVLLAAAVAAGFVAKSPPTKVFGAVLDTVYQSALDAGTGVIAVAVAAHLAEKRMGRWDLAAARMLLAVSLFMLIVSLPQPTHGALRWLLGAAAYALTTILFFRVLLAQWFIMAVVHAGLWTIVYVAVRLAVWRAGTAT